MVERFAPPSRQTGAMRRPVLGPGKGKETRRAVTSRLTRISSTIAIVDEVIASSGLTMDAAGADIVVMGKE
jgi:hypothetical protein